MQNLNTALLIAAVMSPVLLTGMAGHATTPKQVSQKTAFVLTAPPDNVPVRISSDTTEQELVKLLGKKNVKRDAIGVGEGETEPGTVIFPGSPNRRIEIIWADQKQHRFPQAVNLYQPNSMWQTSTGLKLGMPLTEIHKSNGKAFKMSGFDWDYGGRVTDWHNGKIEKSLMPPGTSIALQFNYKQGQKVPNEFIGDQAIQSSNPAMLKLNPTVDAIYMTFDQTKSKISK